LTFDVENGWIQVYLFPKGDEDEDKEFIPIWIVDVDEFLFWDSNGIVNP